MKRILISMLVALLGLTLLGLPFAAFAIGGAGMLLAGVGTRRTVSGRDVWARAGGFERMLSTSSSKDRLDFGARKDLYTSFIPFVGQQVQGADWPGTAFTTLVFGDQHLSFRLRFRRLQRVFQFQVIAVVFH